MKTLVIKSIILLLILATCAAEPVFSQNQEQLFQKALMKEEGEGALQEAIDIYTKIVENSSAERMLRANAQLQIGLCYEKLGKKQATEAYNKVIKQFADQQQTAEIAKTRLQILNTQNAQKELVTNKPLFSQISLDIGKGLSWPGAQPIDFSQDGEKIVFRDTFTSENLASKSALFIAGASGVPVDLLLESFSYSDVYTPKFSPDEKYIAFLGVTDEGIGVPNKGAVYVVNVDGGKPWRITEKFNRGEEFGYLWHPDGKHIVTLNKKKGLVTNNLAGETTNTIRWKYGWDRPGLTGFSPDGKWISYHTDIKTDSLDKVQCWLVSSTGDKNVRLTQNPGIYGRWSAKDYSFYFVSARFGDCNIFKMKIDPETGEKIGDAKQITFYNDANVFSPAIIKDNSTLVYGLQKEIRQIVVPEDENFDKFKTIATGTSPVLSPDGGTVYFVRFGKNNKGIYSIPRTGGAGKKLTDLKPDVETQESRRYLSPDGSVIAFFTEISENKRQLCFLSVNDGKLLKSLTLQSQKVIIPDWSPDSKKVAFVANNILYTIPAWGNRAEILTDKKIGDWESFILRWSPDGKYIAGLVFMDGEGVDNSVVIVSTKTGEVKRLTTKEHWNYKQSIEWYPDSKKLTYMYYDPNKDEDGIWEAYVDGSPSTEMINQPEIWDYVGAWDFKGENYYFLGDTDNTKGWQVYKYNSNTKKIICLSDIPFETIPCISKDGKHLVFTKSKMERQLWMMEGFE